MEFRASSLEVAGLMAEQRFYTRRTGVVFLALVVATNFVPWMEILARKLEMAESSVRPEAALAFGTCLLAAPLVFAAWLFGRRSDGPSRIARPRLLGLQFAILAAGLNLALTGLIALLPADPDVGFQLGFWTFTPIWFLLVLPIQVVAAFCKGRASTRLSRPIAATR